MPTIKTISAALAALAVSGGVAAAASATTPLNIRSGPGTNYQVIGVIPSGAPVAVMGCDGRWCQVSYAGRSGFANGSYLGGEPNTAAIMPNGRGYGYGAAPGYAYGAAPGSAYGAAPGYAYGAAPGYSPSDSYASDDGYDDSGYAPVFGGRYQSWGGGYGGYQGWAGGHNDW